MKRVISHLIYLRLNLQRNVLQLCQLNLEFISFKILIHSERYYLGYIENKFTWIYVKQYHIRNSKWNELPQFTCSKMQMQHKTLVMMLRKDCWPLSLDHSRLLPFAVAQPEAPKQVELQTRKLDGLRRIKILQLANKLYIASCITQSNKK